MKSLREIKDALKKKEKQDAVKDKAKSKPIVSADKNVDPVKWSDDGPVLETKESRSEFRKNKKEEKKIAYDGKMHAIFEKAGYDDFDERELIQKMFMATALVVFFISYYYIFNLSDYAMDLSGVSSYFFSLIWSITFLIFFVFVIFIVFNLLERVLKINFVDKLPKIFRFEIKVSDNIVSKITNKNFLKVHKRLNYLLNGLVLSSYFGFSTYLLMLSSSKYGIFIGKLFLNLCLIWFFAFIIIYLLTWILYYFYIDVRVYQRKIELEKMLPDFLQLVSSNIKSGMPIDKALFFSARPKFGALAREIEVVAKKTLTGEELKDSLELFTKRFDSMLLVRSMSLILEGVDAGGEIGDLIGNIATNIQELQMMKKEMAASVTTYVIFITFAAIIAAPFLMGLSYQLLLIIKGIMGSISMGGDTGASGMSMSFSADAVSLDDFRTFSYATLAVTAFFSASICSIIKTGTIKGGLKNLPTYVITSLVIYKIAIWVLGIFFSGMF